MWDRPADATTSGLAGLHASRLVAVASARQACLMADDTSDDKSENDVQDTTKDDEKRLKKAEKTLARTAHLQATAHSLLPKK